MYDPFGSLLHGYPGLAYPNQYSCTVTDDHGNTFCDTYRVTNPWRDSHANGYAFVYTGTDTYETPLKLQWRRRFQIERRRHFLLTKSFSAVTNRVWQPTEYQVPLEAMARPRKRPVWGTTWWRSCHVSQTREEWAHCGKALAARISADWKTSTYYARHLSQTVCYESHALGTRPTSSYLK